MVFSIASKLRKEYHMALKKLLKSILNVNCIKIKNVEFDRISSSVFIQVDVTKGQKSRCPVCGKKCSGYDSTTEHRTWRSLDFGSCSVYVVSDVNRVRCPEHGVHTEQVPCAYHNSGFTREFEQQVSYLTLHLNKTEVTKLMRINWRTVGAILSRTKDRLEPDSSIRFKNLRRIGIDETSYRKGHKYVTAVLDHDTNQVVWVGKGTGKEVLNSFFEQLTQKQKESIELVSCDGARWIQSCIEELLPNCERCIDGFHVVQWTIDCMDELRKEVWREAKQKKRGQPKRGRGRPKKGEEAKATTKYGKSYKYALGKNPENLTEHQQSCLDEIKELYPKMFRGYQLKEGLRKVFQCSKDTIEKELKAWLSWACRSKLKPFVELSKKIRRHKDAIIATVKHGLSNARIESTNNKIKVLIRKSYGFRNIQNLIDMIMIVCSDLYHGIKLPYELR